MAEPLSPDLLQFIARYIHSVEQLEILCLVSSAPSRPWTVAEVFHEIQSSEKSVTASLRKFEQDGFLKAKENGTFNFSPATPALTDLVHELSRLYRERSVAIVESIYRRPLQPIENFAEAFRLRKDS